MVNLIHIVAVNTPLYAVFVKDDGTPDFRQCACLGTMEAENSGARIVSGFPAGGEHLEAADWKPNFVGYASSSDADLWRERCAAKLAEMKAKAEKAKQSKIIVPDTTPKIFNN